MGKTATAPAPQQALRNEDIAKIYCGENHIYYYHTHDGRKGKLKSVTAALKVIAKDALIGWAADMASKYFKEQVEPNVALTEARIAQIADGMKNEHWREAKRAADVGTRAHELIESFLRGVKLPNLDLVDMDFPGCKNAVERFLDWWITRQLKFVDAEKIVYFAEAGYAGRLDWLASRPDGELVVLDWKTSNGIYGEMELQAVAYLKALARMGYPQPVELWIIRVGKEDAQFEAHEITPGRWDFLFKVFRHCLELSFGMAQVEADGRKIWKAKQDEKRKAADAVPGPDPGF